MIFSGVYGSKTDRSHARKWEILDHYNPPNSNMATYPADQPSHQGQALLSPGDELLHALRRHYRDFTVWVTGRISLPMGFAGSAPGSSFPALSKEMRRLCRDVTAPLWNEPLKHYSRSAFVPSRRVTVNEDSGGTTGHTKLETQAP